MGDLRLLKARSLGREELDQSSDLGYLPCALPMPAMHQLEAEAGFYSIEWREKDGKKVDLRPIRQADPPKRGVSPAFSHLNGLLSPCISLSILSPRLAA